MMDITERIEFLRQRIADAAAACNRVPQSIRLLAVSKTRSPDEIRLACASGLSCFGENYLQEALSKIEALGDQDIEWHFIGPIQSNKTRDLATYFNWVQSVDRLKIARRLNEQRGAWATPLNVCVQVNISREPQKAGVSPEDAADLCQAISELPRLRLRGLMVIPAPGDDEAAQFQNFSLTRALFNELCADGLPLDTLSMGMSADLEAAIRAGTTMLRIGSDIFGPRN